MLSADGPPGPVRPREPHSPYSGQRAALYANSRDRGPAKARDSLDSDAGGRRPPEDDSLRRIIAQLDAEGVHGEDSRYENEDSHFDAGDLGFDFDAELQGQGPPWASPDPNSLGSFTPGSFTPGRHSIDGLSAAYSPDASPIRRREPLNRDSAGSTGLQRTSVNSRPSYGTSPSSYARPSDSHSPFHPHTRYSSGKEGQLPRNLSLGDRDPRIPAPAPIPADSTDFRAHPSREPVFDYDYPNSASRERGQRHAGSFNAHEGSERSFDASSATYRPATTVTTSTGTTLKDRVPVRASDSARESRNSMGEQNLQSALNEARKTADDLRFQNRELRLVLEDTRKELGGFEIQIAFFEIELKT